jgi:membrane associated rhomboid family serine protease
MVEIDCSFFRDAGRILTRPQRKSRPAVTWFLAGLIVTASVHAFFHLQEAVQLFGLIPAQAFRLHGLTFITSFFLHAGIIHLVGNMYFLLVFGDDVENFLGPLRYIALIALAAFVGDLLHIASAPASTIPCIGASGGIAGLITFTPWHFRRRKSAFCGVTFIIFAGFGCQRGSFSCSGFFSKSSALTNKRSELARFRPLRIWGERLWA